MTTFPQTLIGRCCKLATAVVLAGLMTTLVPTPSAISVLASESPPRRTTQAVLPAQISPDLVAQQALDVVATKLTQLAQDRHLPGYAGTAIDQSARRVRLYWHGPIPIDIRQLIGNLVPIAGVDLQQADFDLATLEAEAHRLLSVGAQMSAARIHTVGIRDDFTGLDVTVDPDTSTLPTLTSSVKIFVKSGPRIRTFDCPRDCPGSRWNAPSPYYGGAEIYNSSLDHLCTTGFEAQDNATGAAGQLTAQHCGLNTFWNTPQTANWSWVGNSGNCCVQSDSMLVSKGHPAGAGEYAPYIYTGGWNTMTPARVIGATSNPMNAMRCLGGAVTGEVCNNQVHSGLTWFDPGDGGGQRGPGVWVKQLSGAINAGQGDSGGPMYTVFPITGDISAAGLIEGSNRDITQSCPGVQLLGRICSDDTFVIDLQSALTNMNASLVTAPQSRIYLLSMANSNYVSAEFGFGGNDYGMLRARATAVGAWEQYYLFATSSGTFYFQSYSYSLYVSAELGFTDPTYGELRARASAVGGWEQYNTYNLVGGGYAIQSSANGLYVSTELGFGGIYYEMLRARASSVGAWEQYSIGVVYGS